MRHNTIRLRRALFCAVLLYTCLSGWYWEALAANHNPPVRKPVIETPTPGNTPPAQEVGPTQDPETTPDAGPPSTPKTHTERTELTSEISLQETLDRLGYTVNVPTVYNGRQILRWNDYRISTGDDSVFAERFHCGQSPTFAMLGQQALYAPRTVFGSIDASGQTTALFEPDPTSSGMWLNAMAPSIHADLRGSVRFFIQDTSHSLGTGTIVSTAQSNFDRASHLLVLPALSGGTWIDEGNNRGHWQGGKSKGYLLCWEDWNDFDYQDIVILATHIEPELPESVAKI